MSFRSAAGVPAKWERAGPPDPGPRRAPGARRRARGVPGRRQPAGRRALRHGPAGARPRAGRQGARPGASGGGAAPLRPPRPDLGLPPAAGPAPGALRPLRGAGCARLRHAARSTRPRRCCPIEGRVLFEGMEQEGAALIDNVGSVRARYVQLLQAHRETLAASCGRQGWTLHQPPDRPVGRGRAPLPRRDARTPGAGLTHARPRPARLHATLAPRGGGSTARPLAAAPHHAAGPAQGRLPGAALPARPEQRRAHAGPHAALAPPPAPRPGGAAHPGARRPDPESRTQAGRGARAARARGRQRLGRRPGLGPARRGRARADPQAGREGREVVLLPTAPWPGRSRWR